MTFQILASEIYSSYFTEPISREDTTKLNFEAYLKAAKNAKMLTSRVRFYITSHLGKFWEGDFHSLSPRCQPTVICPFGIY